jgi:hypothetical protein
MTQAENWIILVSLIAFGGWSYWQYRGDKKVGLLVARLMALSAITVLFKVTLGFPFSLAGRGSEVGMQMLVALYISMGLGMVAQYLHRYLELPRDKRGGFDLGQFLAPVLVSPIVFIPLYAALVNSKVDFSAEPSARIMFLLVSFQNGFFWKEYFDSRSRKRVARR